jgi:Fe-S-cluster containining protein
VFQCCRSCGVCLCFRIALYYVNYTPASKTEQQAAERRGVHRVPQRCIKYSFHKCGAFQTGM